MKSKNDGRLWILIFGIIIIPYGIQFLVRERLSLYLNNTLWDELLNVLTILTVAVPFFVYILRQTDRSQKELNKQLKQNEIITEELEEKTFELREMAYYDRFTGLPNSRKLNELLHLTIQDSQNKNIAVYFLYIDQFKMTNNVIGHQLNERFIKHIAHKLTAELPNNTILSRYSGNEFVILLTTNQSEYRRVASDVIKLFYTPFIYDNEETYITASMGASIYPEHGADAKTLIKSADVAMFEAKKDNGSTYQFYSEEINLNAERKLRLSKGLSQVVEKEQLILHYQPLIDLKTDEVNGFEALVRWQHPEYGLVPPNDFISLAEETGEIKAIGRWVLLEACRQTKEWQDNRRIDLNIAVNVSVSQLEEVDFIDYIKDVLCQTKLDPMFLEIEITESMVRDLGQSSAVFNGLKEIGVNIIIDDFGTGYSSLNVLGFLPIDYLKIDRSFIQDMLKQNKLDSIIRTIINMAKNLDLKLVAEGIEEKEQLSLLKSYGCDLGQGYYFSRPIPAVKVEDNWL